MTDFEGSIEGDQSDVIGSLHAINTTLGKAIETIRPPEKSIFTITGARQASHVRFRAYDLVVQAVGAGNTIVLNIGQQQWTLYASFVTPVAGNARYFNFTVPFPVLVDRGVDIWITGSDTLTAWLTYTPE